MSTTAIILVAGTELPNAVATQYTVPSNSTVRISAYSIVNTTAGAETYTIHLVPSGDSADDSNKIADAESVAAKPTNVQVAAAIGQVLNKGDTLQAFASAASALTQRVSGYLIS